MNVFITIDVECYSGDYEREVFAAGLGLEFLLDTLSGAGAPAVFFVEALGATRWGIEPLRQVCDMILRDGHEIQLHIHPVTAKLEGFRDTDDLFCAHNRETQSRLLGEGLRILKTCDVPAVSAFRAGDLAADTHTLAAMRDHGLTLGFNRDLDMKSSIRTRLNDVFPVTNDLSSLDGITDIPVSCVRSPIPWIDGPYRHLQVTAMSLREMQYTLNAMQRHGYRSAAVLTHPGEYFRIRHGQPYPTRINRARLKGLLRFIKHHPELQPTLCADLITCPISPNRYSPPDIKGWLRYAMSRLAEQAVKRH